MTTTSEKPIQLTGKHASICLRLRDASGQWKSGLLATADPEDQFANLIYGNGRDLFYRWRTTPAWKRIKGMQPPSAGANRRIMAGFVEWPGWGGNLAVRELVQYEDGNLGVKWPREVVAESDDAVNLSFEPVTDDASGDGKSISVKAEETPEIGMLKKMPRDVYISRLQSTRRFPRWGIGRI